MFSLELDRVTKEIKAAQAKRVLIQLPDGLKPEAPLVVRHIEQTTGATVFIWLSSCFGACDLPMGLESLKIDLLIAFGHNMYHKTSKEW